MPASPRNLTLLSTLIGAVASVAVAFVGVLPKLREQDRETIEAQRTRLELLAQKVAEFERTFEVGPPDAAPHVRWTISGRVRRADPGDGQGKYEVYLVPGSKHLAVPSDDGRFVFEELFPGSYSVIVRDVASSSNRTARGLIVPGEASGSLESHGAWLEYRVVSQPARTASAEVRQSEEALTALAVAPLPAQNGGLR